MFKQPFIIPAGIFLILALPLIFGLIPRNRLYGIRTQKTLSDDKIWYRINMLGGWAIIISSIIYIIIALAIPYKPLPVDDFSVWLLHLCAFILPLFISLIIIRSLLKKM